MDTHTPMEEMELFRKYVDVADALWRCVEKWKPFDRDTVGKQIVQAADSVGANLVEGDGRYGSTDALHFLIIARASARETRFWIERAMTRNLLDRQEGEHLLTCLREATRQLNALIRFRRQYKQGWTANEDHTEYIT